MLTSVKMYYIINLVKTTFDFDFEKFQNYA